MDTGRDARRPLAWARVPDPAPPGALALVLGALSRARAPPPLTEQLAGDGPAVVWETLLEQGLEWEALMSTPAELALARVRTARGAMLTAADLAAALPPDADVGSALAEPGAWCDGEEVRVRTYGGEADTFCRASVYAAAAAVRASLKRARNRNAGRLGARSTRCSTAVAVRAGFISGSKRKARGAGRRQRRPQKPRHQQRRRCSSTA